MAEDVTKAWQSTYIGGPLDGGVLALMLAPGQENYIQVQGVPTKGVEGAKPWLVHRYAVAYDGSKALLQYQGYVTSDTNPLDA